MLLVALVGLAAAGAALWLYLRVERIGASGLPLALLRALAWGSVAVLLVNPGCRRSLAARPTVLLDASASMSDADAEPRWRAALDTARAIAGRRGQILLFGADPRLLDQAARGDAASSRLLPALREAASRGGPVAVVTDGEIDDAAAIPPDLLAAARIVIIPRGINRDVGVAVLDVAPSLRAGDTAVAAVELASVGTSGADTVTLELIEAGRVAARATAAPGAGGLSRHTLRFVPARSTAEREVRRVEARATGLAGDQEPRNDERATVVTVLRESAIAAVSDSPDWDFRWLVETLAATSGVPVRSFVQLGAGTWREARTLRAMGGAVVQAEVARAALVVVHGGEVAGALARLARGSVWRWPAGTGARGDWYVMAPEFTSPVGGSLAGIPPESLPPLESVAAAPEDADWTALTAQLDRRGRARTVLQGSVRDGRRVVHLQASGLWRWAMRGGVSAEGYRALVASLTDWLLADGAAGAADLTALRDSLARAGLEFLPRTASLGPQEGRAAAAFQPFPLRHAPWLYLLALAALVLEWVARRRRGLR